MFGWLQKKVTRFIIWIIYFLAAVWEKFKSDLSDLKALLMGDYSEEWDFDAVLFEECLECEEEDCDGCPLMEMEEDEEDS